MSDLLLEGLQPLLVPLDKGPDRRLGRRRYLVPEFNRNRRNSWHTNILRPLDAQTSSGRERLPFSFAARDVQSVRITGMEGNDLILMDTKLGLPLSLETDFGGRRAEGLVAVNPLPGLQGAHQHTSNSSGINYLHYVISAWTFQTGWDLYRPGDGSQAGQLSQIAAGLSESSVAASGGAGISLLDGHVFHSLGGTSLALADMAGMASTHGANALMGASGALHGADGPPHDLLLNPPFQGVDHKPG